MNKVLFWAVDCQKDFMNKDGALYVQGAEEIKPALEKLTKLAEEKKLTVVNTYDLHTPGDEEISDTPDFKTTFPHHCMVNSKGWNGIKETNLQFSDSRFNCSIFRATESLEENWVKTGKNIHIYKNKFDVFEGNRHTDEVVKILNTDCVIVYGVSGDCCVDYAIKGLIKRKCKVIAVIDAIKSLKETPVDEWKKMGVTLMSTIDVINFLNETEKNEK